VDGEGYTLFPVIITVLGSVLEASVRLKRAACKPVMPKSVVGVLPQKVMVRSGNLKGLLR
jgi:hypothetical protein